MQTTPPYPQAVVDAVLAAMAEANMTTAELAAKADIKYMTLWRRLNGETPFNVVELDALAEALGVSVVELTTPKEIAS